MNTIDSAVYRAVCAALRLDPDGEAAARMMRTAWTGQPQAPSDADVCYRYAAVGPDDGKYRYPQTAGRGRTAVMTASLPYTVYLIFYGPNAAENALRVCTGIFRDDGPLSPRAVLRGAGIVPLPGPPLPKILREQAGGEWRTRADAEIPCRLLYSEDMPEKPVTGIPDIRLITEEGEQGEIPCERIQS